MTVKHPWHPIPRAILFLWISASLAVLVIGLGAFGGASAVFVQTWMLYLTVPLGILISIGWFLLAMALPDGLAVFFHGRVAATGLWLLFVAVGYWQWFKAMPWLLAKVNLRPFSEPPKRIGRIDIFSCACIALAALSGTAFWLAGLWSKSPGGSPILQWQVVSFSYFAGAIALASGLVGVVIAVRRAQAIAFSMSVVGCIASGFIVLVWFALGRMGSMH
jgi:hypothetical protein